LDDELLAMVPQPCLAVIMLFPMTDAYMAFAQEQEERIAREGQHVSPKIYYMRQTIRNACGTYAVLHSLANNQHRIEIGKSMMM
jgi:ubiquitin carboxyl-terminal hydrolase L3